MASQGLPFRVQDVPPLPAINHQGGILRWNADPHTVDDVERSLDGGLRYSISGGSYEAFLAEFQWEGTAPTVNEFQEAIEHAFADWEQVDPATGLGTELRFVPDLETPVVLVPPQRSLEEGARLNPGAEIDILGVPLANSFLRGRAVIYGDPVTSSVTLTSGVSDYQAVVISGADVHMANDNIWASLDEFRLVLSHELGHAIGLADVDLSSEDSPTRTMFYDDNFDNTSDDSAHKTLTNSFAELIDPLDPNNTAALNLYELCDNSDDRCVSRPGVDTPGVDIHMETSFQVRAPGPQNDDFAGRQFLYPFVRVTGDFDADEQLTVNDVDLLISEVDAEQPRLWFDLNSDQAVDVNDVGIWVKHLQNTWIGDANLDGEFNSGDFIEVFQAGKYETDTVASWAEGDWNGDQRFDSGDFIAAFQDGGYERGPRLGFAAVSVPEPLGMWLPIALLGILFRHRRR
ncbi:MAG: hypothetical protein KDB27_33200 [Planctomycetales bacterium]|nr:hypothetical protein [Planctomycetales bacterium]